MQDTGSTLTTISDRLNSLESSVPQVESQLSSRLDAVESSIKDIMNHVMQNQNTNFKLIMDGIVALQTKMTHEKLGIVEAAAVPVHSSPHDESKLKSMTNSIVEGTGVESSLQGIHALYVCRIVSTLIAHARNVNCLKYMTKQIG